MSNRAKSPPRRPKTGPNRPSDRHKHRANPTTPTTLANSPSHKSGGRNTRGTIWFYGVHTVLAAISNPNRAVHRVLLSGQSSSSLQQTVASAMTDADREAESIEIVDRTDFDRILPDSAVHQGIAALVSPLPGIAISDLPTETDAKPARVLVLDQANDPQNIGAVIRTAAAFGAAAVIVPEKNTPPITPAMAKAASGGLEVVPLIRATNLARALYNLKDQGFWCIGLDAKGVEPLSSAMIAGPCALVMGAEGKGLRRLTIQACDSLSSIPIESVASLNVSVAAAIALYESIRDR